jgi:hypothetical protein
MAQNQAARFALQMGATDRMLGRLVARLRDQGLWQDTLLVISADHGINFEPGMASRRPAQDGTLDELYRVPMLIHTPGQSAGAVTDEPVSTADILPTVLGVLGAPPLAHPVGLDLAHVVPATRPRLVWSVGKSWAFPPDTTSLAARIARYAGWYPAAPTGWARFFQRGPYATLYALPTPASGGAAAGYRIHVRYPRSLVKTSGISVVFVMAQLDGPVGARVPDGTVVVASGGRVVGFLGGAAGATGAGVPVEGLLDWRLAGAPGGLEFYLASGPASSPTLARIAAA